MNPLTVKTVSHLEMTSLLTEVRTLFWCPEVLLFFLKVKVSWQLLCKLLWQLGYRSHAYYIMAVHAFKRASPSHDSHSNTQRFYSSQRWSSQQKYSNVSYPRFSFFFFFFSKINTALFSKQSFFQKKTDEDCVKICSLKSYRVTTHTKALWTWTTVDALEIAAIWTNAWGKESKSWPSEKWNSLSWILYFYVSYVFCSPPFHIYALCYCGMEKKVLQGNNFNE